jgi:pyrrolidone-carboxylate peptidase
MPIGQMRSEEKKVMYSYFKKKTKKERKISTGFVHVNILSEPYKTEYK